MLNLILFQAIFLENLIERKDPIFSKNKKIPLIAERDLYFVESEGTTFFEIIRVYKVYQRAEKNGHRIGMTVTFSMQAEL